MNNQKMIDFSLMTRGLSDQPGITEADVDRLRETFRSAVVAVLPEGARRAVVEAKWENSRTTVQTSYGTRGACPMGVAVFSAVGNRADPMPCNARKVEEDLFMAGIVAMGDHPLTDDEDVRIAIGRFMSLWDHEILEPVDLPGWFGVDVGSAT